MGVEGHWFSLAGTDGIFSPLPRHQLGSSGLSASKTLVGFLNTKAAEGLSPRTLQNYEHRLRQWIDYAGDVAVAEVTPQIIRRYLTWLRTE